MPSYETMVNILVIGGTTFLVIAAVIAFLLIILNRK